jgi:hypothetical protein
MIGVCGQRGKEGGKGRADIGIGQIDRLLALGAVGQEGASAAWR